MKYSSLEPASLLWELTHHTVSPFLHFHQPTKAGARFNDPGRMQGRVALIGWLQTDIIYPSEPVTHPSTELNVNLK